MPLNEIDLVVSFDDADKKCGDLPAKAKVERWSVPNPAETKSGDAATLSNLRQDRDEIDKRVSALFLDYWRNIA